MVLLSWIVAGAIAGWLSGQVMKGRGFGLRGDVAVGVAGGLIGGFLAVMVFKVPNAVNGLNLTSTLVAFFGRGRVNYGCPYVSGSRPQEFAAPRNRPRSHRYHSISSGIHREKLTWTRTKTS